MLPQKFLRQKGKQIRDCNRYIVDALKIDLRNMIDLKKQLEMENAIFKNQR